MPNKPQKIEIIPVTDLHFDPDNPRLPNHYKGQDDVAIMSWMLREVSLLELMGSISEQGFFPGEPLLAVTKKKGDGYTVIEGNRRLAAVKLILNPDLAAEKKNAVQEISNQAKEKPKALPTLIFPSRGNILDYLGYRHITGIKPWSSLAKAKYLKQLFDQSKEKNVQDKFKELAKIIGSRADYVARLLTSLGVYNRIADDNAFFGIRGLGEEDINFSLLTTALSYSNIASFLGLSSSTDPSLNGLDDKRLGELTSWLFERDPEHKTRLGESRRLRELSAVVDNKNTAALDAFRKGKPLTEAVILTEMPVEVFRYAISEAKSRLQLAQEYLYMIKKLDTQDASTIEDIGSLAHDLRTLIRKRLSEASRD